MTSQHAPLAVRSLRLVMAASLLLALPAAGQDGSDEMTKSGGDWQPQLSEYTVQSGDTLWDISARIVGSPWLWPKVWSYNPEIHNPHWIYPGDVVRFYPSEQALPLLADLASTQRAMPEEGVTEAAPQPEPEIRKHKAVDFVEAAPLRRVSNAPPEKSFVGIFVTARELAEDGELTNAVSDKMLLGTRDTVFLTFPKNKLPNKGDRYMSYRTLRRIDHPVNGKDYGFVTQLTGFLTIEEVEGAVARAVVDKAVVEIERGQMVTPLVTIPIVDLVAKPASAELKGYVLAVETGLETVSAARRLVFVDIGSKQGLEVGNRLSVLTGNDTLGTKGAATPLTRIGTLLVVDVKDNASTAWVLDSRREIEPGQQLRTIVLAPAGTASAD